MSKECMIQLKGSPTGQIWDYFSLKKNNDHIDYETMNKKDSISPQGRLRKMVVGRGKKSSSLQIF